MRNANQCPKGIGLESNLIKFLEEKKNVIDFLVANFHSAKTLVSKDLGFVW